MSFFGREREMSLARAVASSATGAVCIYSGGSGSGKTALAHEIAREHDAPLLQIDPVERIWAYSGLSAISASLCGPRGRAIDNLLSRANDWQERPLAEELSRLLRTVHDQPVTLVIDDLDAMDAPSLTVLAFVLSRVRGTGVRVLATTSSLAGRLDSFSRMTHTHIDRLSFDESIAMARSVAGSGTVLAVLHMIALLTDGDPGALSRVRLTARQASGEDPLCTPLRLVDEPRAPHQDRAPQPLDPNPPDLFDVLAVGPVCARDALRSVAVELGADLYGLIDDGLVRTNGQLIMIADPSTRARHYSALSGDNRRRLHELAAAHHTGVSGWLVQWHESFITPTTPGLPLLDAALDLTRGGETVAGIEVAERALALPIPAQDRGPGLVALGDELVRRGHHVLGRHYLRRAGTPVAADMQLQAAIAELRSGAITDRVVDDTVLSNARTVNDPVEMERLLCEAARLHLSRAEFDAAFGRISEAVKAGATSARAEILAGIGSELGVALPLSTPDTGGQTVPPDDPDTAIELASLVAGLLLMREEYAAAVRQVQLLLNSRPSPAPMWREQLMRIVVAAETRRGDLLAAREAVTAWRREWLHDDEPDAASVMLLGGVAAIDPDDCQLNELIERGRELCRREEITSLLPFFAAFEGGLALKEGRIEDAVAALRVARDLSPGGDPALVRVDADLIEALWLNGQRIEALQELARFEAEAARHPRRWSTLAVARSHAVCRSGSAELDHAFREAEAIFRPDDSPHERRRLHEARKRCIKMVDSTPACSPRHTQALIAFLTPEEREIVALVGQGMRNREIASTLFLSLRTVESRLTGIYRELGVKSRAQLVAKITGASTFDRATSC